MALPRPSTPAAAWRDLKAFLDQRGRYRYVFAAVSILMPALIVTGFYLDSRTEPPGPQLIYVQSWSADRSDEVIKAQQKIDQALRDAAREARRQEYQRVADQLGIE